MWGMSIWGMTIVLETAKRVLKNFCLGFSGGILEANHCFSKSNESFRRARSENWTRAPCDASALKATWAHHQLPISSHEHALNQDQEVAF